MGKNRSAAGDEEWPQRLEHFFHPQHPLVKTLRPGYICDGCHLSDCVLLGKNWSYHCAVCDFDLHPKCAIQSPLLTHPLHRDHPLVKTPLVSFWCAACSEKGRQLSYSCAQCNFHLHPECAQEDAGRNGHEERIVHELTKTSGRGSYWCDRCAEEGNGWSYHCEDCGLDVHPKCGAKMRRGSGNGSWPKTAAHRSHAEHGLARTRKEDYLCNGCYQLGRGWAFSCDVCLFNLHPKCAFESEIRDPSGSGISASDLMQQHGQERVDDTAGNNPENREMTAPEQQMKMVADLDAEQARTIMMMTQFQQMKMYNDAFANVGFMGIDSGVKAMQVALRIPTQQQPPASSDNFFAPNKYFKPF